MRHARVPGDKSDEVTQCRHAGMHERNRHQIEAVLARPAKCILVASCSHPDRRVRSLYGLGQNMNIVEVKELAVKVERFVGPRPPQYFGSFNHTLGGFFTARAESHILNGLAALADAKVQAAVQRRRLTMP